MVYLSVALGVVIIALLIWLGRIKMELDDMREGEKYWRVFYFEILHRYDERIAELDLYKKTYWPIPKKDQQ